MNCYNCNLSSLVTLFFVFLSSVPIVVAINKVDKPDADVVSVTVLCLTFFTRYLLSIKMQIVGNYDHFMAYFLKLTSIYY